MMKKILTGIAFCASIFLLNSCTKDDPHYDIVDVSKQKMMSHGYWDMVEYTIDLDIDNENILPQSIYASLASCIRDNFYEFTLDGKMLIHENYTKCSVDDPDIHENYFSLSDKEENIKVWEDDEDPENSFLFQGKMKYPNVNEFNWTYNVWNSATEKMEEHRQYFVQRLEE